MPRLLLSLTLLFCFSVCNKLPAQDLEEEFPPGLLARYTAGERSIERIDERIAFVWKDSVPDLRLPVSSFVAEWTALQLIRKNDTYRYALYLAGDAELFLDGKSILKASSNKPGWFQSEPIELRFGEHDFKLTYRKSSPDATLKLFWSSNAYPLEPVPRESFFREESHPESKRFDEGRRLFVSRRCANCHDTELPLPELAAPSLENVEKALSADWIVGKLTDPETTDTHGKMPRFGFNKDDAQAIAACLLDLAKEADLQELPKSKDKTADLTEGERLLHARGCLACHQMNGIGNDDAYAGSALDRIASKRSPDWIFTWLTSPDKLNRDHRMPIVELSKDERRQLAVYLASKGELPKQAGNPDKSLVARGKKLIVEARCANCHRIPGIEASREGLPALAELKQEPGCPTRSLSLTAPSYASQKLDQPAIIFFLNQFPQTDTRVTVNNSDQGRLLLETKNCIQCHPRGRSQGIVGVAGKVSKSLESLRGESEAMIPPSLDAVGDKLKDDALLKSVSGEQPRRMDWLHIRMPKFKHTKEEAQLLAETFIAEDRIPDGAPDPHIFTVEEDQKTSPEELLTSNTLVGPRGFSCVACHSLGDYKPRNVALGTRGSNLLDIGKRMRSSYFIRWTRAPIRIVPGMEMPSIGHKPVPGILDADIDRQLAVIWKGINDPDFTIPTDPASVEQFWVVAPGEPARIVRDVFELSEETGDGYVARSLAVGFNNQHSILFDLDLFEPRVWTYGDFARQKTAGKSWYWNMAGVPVKAWKSSGGGFRILRDGAFVEARKDNSQIGQLQSYRPIADGIELNYSLWFDTDAGADHLDVREVWQPIHESPAGWKRTIFTDAKKRPDHPELVLMIPETRLNRSGNVVVLSEDRERRVNSAEVALVGNELTLAYRKKLSEPFLAPKPKPIVINEATPITSAPGFDGVRLPLRGDIMPTGICWDEKGRMYFTSLKGDLFRATDSDSDGVEDRLDLLAEGLSAPYGVISFRPFDKVLDGEAERLLVAQKPEVLELIDRDGDGTYEDRRVFASGWGFSDNYHDWTCGFARDAFGNFYVGLGSDYSQPDRPKERSRWRGSVLRIAYDSGEVTPIAHSFRYPTGVAIDPKGRLFATDNQGVQNTFNELNHLQVGKYYGVPSRHEENPDAPITPPAIQIPHPWVRSVNGLAFVPDNIPALAPLAGHGIGCEYNSRLLVRFTLQEVDGILQGATYYFTKPIEQATPDNFIGPISIGISKQGEIYIGSILDSGWLGGQNIGAIAKLTPQKEMPNGIRELTATKDGFRLEFFQPVDRSSAEKTGNYSISGYTRNWGGSYATPDSDRHRAEVSAARISKDGRSVDLVVEGRREGFVYEVTAQNLSTDETPLFPETGHFTLHRIPRK